MNEHLKARLLIASRIAAGAMANKENMVGTDHENRICRAAWNMAGKLYSFALLEADAQRVAETGMVG